MSLADDCVDNSCKYGKCVDGHNQYTCNCHEGWMFEEHIPRWEGTNCTMGE